MRYNVVIRYIGLVLLLNALFMLLSVGVSVYNGFDTGLFPLLMSALLTMAMGAFPLIFVESDKNISTKEGYTIVVGVWFLSCFVGMLPYLLWGGEFYLATAWFESVSGFTTTGSTILRDVEAVPRSLIFWRASTHWLGGVGVMMFVLVVLPSLGRAKTMLSNLQMSSLAKDNFRYRTQKIVQILLVVYIGLTFAQTILLKIAGMNWFDAVTHSFSTIATGGFSNRNLSIAYYDSVWIESIITFFMLVSGLHFGLIFATLIGKSNNIFRSEVSRYYIISTLAGGVVIALSLWAADIYHTLPEALRHGIFQIVSVTTTTGFATADSNVWTPTAVLILIFFSFVCACSGSTAGGIKADRVWLSYKSIVAKVRQLQHPNAIIRVKMDNITQSSETLSFVNLFIVMYIIIVVIGTFVLTFTGLDLITSFSVSFSSMANVGPGFGMISSLNNYSGLPDVAKIISTLLMLIGRLEIFGFIQILVFKLWK